jgi:hypothetical protein
VAELTFFAVEDPLAESELVAAFATAFESHAFASFTIEGLTAGLKRTLQSCGNRVRGNLDPYVHRLMSSQAVRTRLPELAIDQAHRLAELDSSWFEVLDPLLLEGSLAMALRDGGPYSRLPTTDSLRLALDFRTKLIGERYEDLQVVTGSGWTEWFYQIVWDYGWVMTDLRNLRIHLLCASGND